MHAAAQHYLAHYTAQRVGFNLGSADVARYSEYKDRDPYNMPTPKMNRELLLAAIDGFEFQKLRIDAQINEIKQQLADGAPPPQSAAAAAPKSGRKKFSAAARRKMAASQKARWAKIKGQSAPAAKTAAPKAAKAKRRLSAAGRAAIVAALKKRWAAKKTGGTAAKAAKKKTAKAPAQASQAVA